MLGALTFLPSEPCNTPLTVNGGQAHGKTTRKVVHHAHDSKRSVWFLSLRDKEIPTSQRRDGTLHERHKSDKELPFLAFFFFLSLW
jgi:hypothetical protein